MRNMRKNYQRKFNKVVRALNRNIANDDLWRGRFYFFQKDMRFEEFEDHSGGMMHIVMRGYDKKTGYYKDFIIEWAPYLTFGGHRIWEMANHFIAEDSGVWYEEPRINRVTAPDWTGVRVDTGKVGAYEPNYYVSYKYWKENNNG